MSEKRVMVDVDHVTVRFNMASQKVDNLKEYFVKMMKRELMFQEFLDQMQIFLLKARYKKENLDRFYMK